MQHVCTRQAHILFISHQIKNKARCLPFFHHHLPHHPCLHCHQGQYGPMHLLPLSARLQRHYHQPLFPLILCLLGREVYLQQAWLLKTATPRRLALALFLLPRGARGRWNRVSVKSRGVRLALSCDLHARYR